MKTVEILPAKRLRGEAAVPGDKSIAHRIALIGAIAEGTTAAEGFPPSADCLSTLGCLERLGVGIERGAGPGHTVFIHGMGLGRLTAPETDLDAGNSGTTARLLSGVLAGHQFTSRLVGDESLSRRPMQRIVEPLERFGAQIETTGGHLPMTIAGGAIRAIEYRLPVPSAQVKSAVLLAGLHAEGTTSVHEPIQTRNHTEVCLVASGAAVRVIDMPGEGLGGARRIEVDGGHTLRARSIRIPGDLSSAAFLVASSLIVPGSELLLRRVGVNPTRADFLSVVRQAGAAIRLESERDEGGEPTADIVVRASALQPIDIDGDQATGLIDELPVLSVLGVCGAGRVTIRGAAELRHKESDRIRAVATNLAAVGARVEEFDDGLSAECDGPLEGGTVSSFGDHRIAMAFAVAGLASRRGVRIENAGCVDISFPGFFDLLEGVAER